MDAVWDVEAGVILWIQSWSGWLEPPMQVVTALGSDLLFLALLPLLFWCVDARLGARAYLVATGAAVANGVLKVVAYGPRPYWFTPAVAPMSTEPTFGMPSGHAQTAVPLWGYVAVKTRRRWAWPVAGTLIGLIAVSRIHLGAAFITDVVVGLAMGFLLLWLALRYEEAALHWWRERGLGIQAALAFGLSLLPGAATVAWQATVRGGWSAPGEWTGPMPPDAAGAMSAHMFLLGGGLFGVLVGLSLLVSRGWYSAEGSLISRVARYVIGITGTLLIMVALRVAIPGFDGFAGALIGYGGSVLTSLWAVLGAPELFIRMGIAQRPADEEIEQPVPA